MQFVYNIIRFEPRKLKHRSAAETLKVLLKKNRETDPGKES